jgi:hypothetical protein
MEISAILHWSRAEVEDLEPAELLAAHEHAMVIAKALRGAG